MRIRCGVVDAVMIDGDAFAECVVFVAVDTGESVVVVVLARDEIVC